MPEMIRIAVAFFILTVPLVSRGEEGLIESADQCIYAKDGLYLKVALLDDPKAFLAAWREGGPPPLRTRTSFHRGDIVFPAVMYSTNALNGEGKADITYTLLFRRPDGSIYEHMQDLVVVNGTPRKGIGLCKARSALQIEDTDPFGDYTLKVTITDKIKDVSVEMLFTFSVVDPNAKSGPTPQESTEPEAPAVESPTPMPTTRMRSFSDDRR